MTLDKTSLILFILMLSFLSGTPALTSRLFKEADIEKAVEFLDEGIQIAQDVMKKTGERSSCGLWIFWIYPGVYSWRSQAMIMSEDVNQWWFAENGHCDVWKKFFFIDRLNNQ